MANNRMYLVCVECAFDEAKDLDACRLYLGAYYPSQGWSASQGRSGLDAFFDRHSHGSLLGEDITLCYESVFSQTARDKQDILQRISEQVARVRREGAPPAEGAKL